ncbi:hypothetical protein BR93DRAFT_361254 [Coniochaeta sp. PMI_546]|nr:hypothetical protein BR93DRAFT_361254 [Coniochaeta sp. PMI_546]
MPASASTAREHTDQNYPLRPPQRKRAIAERFPQSAYQHPRSVEPCLPLSRRTLGLTKLRRSLMISPSSHRLLLVISFKTQITTGARSWREDTPRLRECSKIRRVLPYIGFMNSLSSTKSSATATHSRHSGGREPGPYMISQIRQTLTQSGTRFLHAVPISLLARSTRE